MLLSELIGKEVVDQGGRRLGVVHDVAAVQDGPVMRGFGAALRVDSLIFGSRGVWARLGVSDAHVQGPWILRALARSVGSQETVPWDDVVAVEPDRIVVRSTSSGGSSSSGSSGA
jgi:sporulation protein YlmC with PRC-barrel domain